MPNLTREIPNEEERKTSMTDEEMNEKILQANDMLQDISAQRNAAHDQVVQLSAGQKTLQRQMALKDRQIAEVTAKLADAEKKLADLIAAGSPKTEAAPAAIAAAANDMAPAAA